MTFREEIKDKKVLVFGLGLQGGGLGDVQWLHANGAMVRVTDQKAAIQLADVQKDIPSGVETSFGAHKKEDVEWADIVIKNPGVPDDHELIKYAKSLGLPVLTSIAVFVRKARDKTIGITGTRGKSTTTELVYRLLESIYPGQVIRGGNIPGTSGLKLLDSLETAKYAVLELSSFQLHNFHSLRLSPHIAVITNIYPDHLNRYPSLSAYAEDKRAITAYQNGKDFVVANSGNAGASELITSSTSKKVFFGARDVPKDWEIHIPGEHNKENIAAVIAVAQVLNINSEQVKKVVSNFHGLPFRLEKRGTKNGITYINDTTASTPVAATIAIKAMNTPTAIIVGGQTKELPDAIFVDALVTSPQIIKIVILGAKELFDFTNELRRRCPEKIVGQVFSMQEAVSLATANTKSGDTVLLSPGFTSFDLFPNEFDRGRQFNECVDKL